MLDISIIITRCTSTTNTTYLANRNIKYIVVHYTAGTTSRAGTARNTALMFSRPATNASADFIVDNETIIQFNPDIKNRYCWHAGSSIGKYNTKGGSLYKIAKSSNSIGIEVCSSSKNGQCSMPNADYFYFTDAVVRKTAELVAYLMKAYNISINNVIRHYDVTGKLCPGIKGWNADSGSEYNWVEFKKTVQSIYTNGVQIPVTPVQQVTQKPIVEEDEDMTLDTFKNLMRQYRQELQDNDCGSWSEDARQWAINNKMINGISTDASGNPNYAWADNLTREQMVVLLYRFAQFMGKA